METKSLEFSSLVLYFSIDHLYFFRYTGEAGKIQYCISVLIEYSTRGLGLGIHIQNSLGTWNLSLSAYEKEQNHWNFLGS